MDRVVDHAVPFARVRSHEMRAFRIEEQLPGGRVDRDRVLVPELVEGPGAIVIWRMFF